MELNQEKTQDHFTPPLHSTSSKILIRTPNWLGDLMMSTAFIAAVLKHHPQAQVDLIVKAGFETLPLPHRGHLLPFDKKQSSPSTFGKQLRASQYDQFYILPPSFSSAWMAFQSQIPQRIGYAGNGRRWLLKPAMDYPQPPRSQHLIQEYLHLLDPSLQLSDFPPELSITPEWLNTQLNSLGFRLHEPYVVFAPGAIYGPAKQWPATSYREVAKSLVQQGFHVFVIGTPADIDLGNTIAEGGEEIYNVCGQTNLTQLLAILAQSQLLISNDSGSMHMMAALQKTQIAIFGSTSTQWTGPINAQAHIFTSSIDCSPCFQKTCRFQHYQCLQDTTAQQVLEQAQLMMNNVSSK